MTALEQYQNRVVAQMNPPAVAAAPGSPLVVGFDFMSLIGVLLPVLIDIISGCLKPKTTAALADELVKANDNIWIRMKAQAAVNDTCRDCGQRLSASERQRLAKAVLTGVGTRDEAIAVLTELRAQEWGT